MVMGETECKWGEISRRPCACLPLVQIESDSLNSEKASFFSLSLSNGGNNSRGLPEDVT